MSKLYTTVSIAFLSLVLIGAETATAPTPAPTATTNIIAGTVTSVVDPGKLTHGRDVLRGIARDPKTGDLYIGVTNVLMHFTPFIGMTTSNDDSLRRISPSGEVVRVTSFPYPNDIAINPRDGKLYVATGAINCSHSAGGMPYSSHCVGTNGIVVVDPATGEHHDFVGAGPGLADGVGTEARFTAVAGIVIDPDDGAMYVTDYGNHLIRKVTADGTVTTLAGAGTKGAKDGTGTAAEFNGPRGIAYCAKDKSLYVADRDNEEIRRVTLDGVVTTVAGAPEAGYLDGPGTTARFDHPQGVACDAPGNVYVSDTDNNAIRQISPAGIVSTLAGNKDMGTVNAVGSAARFANPSDLLYEPSDTSLYVIDRGANGVRKVTTVAGP